MDANGWAAVAAWVGAVVAVLAAIPAAWSVRQELALRRCDLRVLYMRLAVPLGRPTDFVLSVTNEGPATARKVTARLLRASGDLAGAKAIGGMNAMPVLADFTLEGIAPPAGEPITLVLTWVDGCADEWEETIRLPVGQAMSGDGIPDAHAGLMELAPYPVRGVVRRLRTRRRTTRRPARRARSARTKATDPR